MTNNATSYGTLQAVRAEQPRLSHPRAHYARRFCCVSLLVVTLILFFFFFVLFPQSPLCLLSHLSPSVSPSQQPDFRDAKFAVGFDLTAGYGTAAVSFQNGSTVNVAMVEGDSRYKEVMARLSLESSAHPTPPYYTTGCAYLPRQWRRQFRKRLGLPASEDVGALANVLSQLKPKVEDVVSRYGEVRYALVTVPYLPALYNEDLVDACDFVGIQYIMPQIQSGDAAQWAVSEINTAYAGMGLGNCDDLHLNNPECNQQRVLRDTDNIFSVSFTGDALIAHVSPISTALHFYAADGVLNFSLGANALIDGRYEEGAESLYWQRVRLAIRQGLASYLNRGAQLESVVSHGDSSEFEEFQNILRDEVTVAQDDGFIPTFYNEDPVFAAAKGAAELAKTCMLPGHDCVVDLTPRWPGW